MDAELKRKIDRITASEIPAELRKAGIVIDTSLRLGSGGFGVAFKGEFNGEPRAIKISFDPTDHEIVKNELERGREFWPLTTRHPGLATTYTWQKVKLDETEERLVLVQELADTSLRHFSPANEDEALNVIEQLTDALDFLHRNDVVHRDIKPSNILICNSKNLTSLIADFGLARKRHSGPATGVGTSGFMCDDQRNGDGAHPFFDVFAFACTILDLMFRFKFKRPISDLSSLLKDHVRLQDTLSQTLPSGVRALYLRVLSQQDKSVSARELGNAISDCYRWVLNASASNTRLASTRPNVDVRVREEADRVGLTDECLKLLIANAIGVSIHNIPRILNGYVWIVGLFRAKQLAFALQAAIREAVKVCEILKERFTRAEAADTEKIMQLEVEKLIAMRENTKSDAILYKVWEPYSRIVSDCYTALDKYCMQFEKLTRKELPSQLKSNQGLWERITSPIRWSLLTEFPQRIPYHLTCLEDLRKALENCKLDAEQNYDNLCRLLDAAEVAL